MPNLYELHNKPEILDHHEKLKTHYPAIVWEHLKEQLEREERYTRKDLIAEYKKYESVWAKDASHSLEYSRLSQKPFPAGEPAIAKDAHSSFYYARDVLKKPFPLGERAIVDGGSYVRLYLREFPERAQTIQELQKKTKA